MAAVDPDEEPELEDGDSGKRPRATLRIVRPPPGMDMGESDDEDDDDYSDEDEDDSEDDEEINGGPSDKEKARKLKEAAARKELEDAMDEDDDEEEGDDDDEGFDLKAAISKLIKGKAPATDDDDDEESDEGLELDETVVCTLDPESVCHDDAVSIDSAADLCTELPAASRYHRFGG